MRRRAIANTLDLRCEPLTPDRLADFEELFGARGACAGCWCMWFRIGRKEFEANKGEGNRRAIAALVRAGGPPGILAYAGTRAIGWCALAPRAEYPRLARSRVLAPVDSEPVWSVTCFFVARGYRRRGVTVRLIEAAAAFARERGAMVLEAYPTEPRNARVPDAFAFTGLPSAFRRAGFTEVARRSPTRPIMRLRLVG